MEPDENGNINCTNCSDCRNCVDCSDCSNCVDCIRCSDLTYCTNCVDCLGGASCINCNNCQGCTYCFYSNGLSSCNIADHCYVHEDNKKLIDNASYAISVKNYSHNTRLVNPTRIIGFTLATDNDNYDDIDLQPDYEDYCSSDIYDITEVKYGDIINLKPKIGFTSNSISMFTADYLPSGLSIDETTGVISGRYENDRDDETYILIQTTELFGSEQYITPLTFVYNENRNLNCINCIGCSNCIDCINCNNCNNCYNCSNCSDCSYFDTCENCNGGGEYAVNCKNCIISGNNVIYVQNDTLQEVAGNTCSSNLYSIQRVFQTQRVNINPNCVYTSNTQIVFSATENIEYLEVTSDGNISGDINFFNDLNTNILVTYQGLTYNVPLKFNIVEPDENGNVNCTNCTNCHRCWDCIECIGCADCKNCNNCTSCWKCMNLQSCSYYDNCMNCSNGDHCVDCIYLSDCNSCVYLKGSADSIIQSKTGEFGDLSVNLGEIYSTECVLFDKDLKYTSNNSSIYKYGQWGSNCNTFIFNPTKNKYITVEYNGISKQYPINVTYKEPYNIDENGNIDCINCTNCSNCIGCVDCILCNSCTNCISCTNCLSCMNCSQISGSGLCSYCINTTLECIQSIKLNKCYNCIRAICCSNSSSLWYSTLCKYVDAASSSYIYDCYNVGLGTDGSIGWKGPKVSSNYDDYGCDYGNTIYGYGISSTIYNVFDLNKNKYVNIHPSYNYNDIISLNNLLNQYSYYLSDMGIDNFNTDDLSIDVSNNNLNINNEGIISQLTNYTDPINTEEINITINMFIVYNGSTPLTIYLPDESNNLHCISCYNCQNCYKCNNCNNCSYCMNVSNSDYLVDCTNCKNCNTCIYLNDLSNVTNSIGSGIYILEDVYRMNSPVNIPPNFEFTSDDNIVFTGDFNNGLSINQSSGIITGNIQQSPESNYVNIKYNNQTFTVDLDFNIMPIYDCYVLNNAFAYKT